MYLLGHLYIFYYLLGIYKYIFCGPTYENLRKLTISNQSGYYIAKIIFRSRTLKGILTGYL